jgi:hypothetical protein
MSSTASIGLILGCLAIKGLMEPPPNKMNKIGNILRSLAATAVVAHFIWFFWFNKESVGYFSETNNGATRIYGGTTPAHVLAAIFGIALFCILMTIEVRVEDFQIPSIWRRFAAFLIDFYFSLFTLSSVGAIIPLLLEARRTGAFKWHFQRDHFVASDAVDTALVFVVMAGIIFYFALPLAWRRQTVGCFILRIATASAGGSVLYLPLSTALWRTYREFIGLCSPIRTIKERDSQGRTWYDRETGFMVVRY